MTIWGGDSGNLSCRVYSSKGQERGRGQSKERDWKVKNCKGEGKEKEVRVYPITPEWDNSKEHCHLGECYGIPSGRIQV